MILGSVLALYYYISHVIVGTEPSTSVTVVSPNSQTTIELSEKVEETSPPTSRNSVVRFTAFYSGNRIIDNEPLLVDSPGLHFFSRYPKQVWVSDSTLRLIQSSAPPEPMRAELLVINETSKEVTYLWVTAGDIFLLTRLQPKSRIKLEAESVSSQRGELSYLSAKGRFVDGSHILEQSANFNVNRKYVNPAHYSIVINGAGVVITSQEFERHSF